jgi:ubiquinone/menaquinone biosynthesis C-methylase UbiE
LPTKDTETVRKWYDAVSSGYDELYGEEQSKKHAKVMELLGDRVFNLVVDVGCGTGRFLESIAPRSKVVLGVDVSLRMLATAKKKAPDSAVELVRASASVLPLRDQVADGIVSVSVIQSGPMQEEHSNELLRIAKEHAALVMTVFADNDRGYWKHLTPASVQLVAELSDRERLYLIRKTNPWSSASSGSSALV